MSVEAEVMAIVSEQLGVALEKLSADPKFGDDLGADSLHLPALIITIEQRSNFVSARKEWHVALCSRRDELSLCVLTAAEGTVMMSGAGHEHPREPRGAL